jgi:hypothetical protein
MAIENKKGVELALNMIILVTLGIVILVIGIVLLRKVGQAVGDEIPKIVDITNALWKPTADNPFVISPSEMTIKHGGNRALTLQVYDYAEKDVLCNLGFDSVGQGDSSTIIFTYATTNTNIPVGMVGEWKINVNAPKTIAPDVYMYRLNIDCEEFSKQSDIIITVT